MAVSGQRGRVVEAQDWDTDGPGPGFEPSQLGGHSIFYPYPPPQGGLLDIPYSSEFYFKVFPLDSQIILGLQTPWNITFNAILLLNLIGFVLYRL